MRINPIVLAVPMYFVMMALEAWIDRRRKTGVYRLADTLTNLSTGVYQTVAGAVFAAVLTAPYAWIYEHHRVSDWFAAHSTIAWCVAFIGSDFFYYWFHRWSHESAVGWFSHVVHHQSEEYNLSVALRQDAWQPFFSLWFQLPLAWLGVPPSIFATAYGLMIVYQFWIHTRFIDTMGPFEWVFNTPSHHRVHHGINNRYLDKNYAGVLIVWDRIFGTFEPERETPVYGTIDAVASWNPVWVHLVYGVKLAQRVRAQSSWWHRLQVLVEGPGWRSPEEPRIDVESTPARLAQPPYDMPTTPSVRRYAVATFVLAFVPVAVALAPATIAPWSLRAVMMVLAFWLFANVGGMLESRVWSRASQYVALAVTAIVGLALTWVYHTAWSALPIASVAMMAWLRVTAIPTPR